MKQSTGQLDKLIEQKVDEKIRQFSSSITEQIRTFLKENGDYSGEWLYQKTNEDEFNHRSVNDAWNNLKKGLDLTIKDKMIERATKELLNKVSLLS